VDSSHENVCGRLPLTPMYANFNLLICLAGDSFASYACIRPLGLPLLETLELDGTCAGILHCKRILVQIVRSILSIMITTVLLRKGTSKSYFLLKQNRMLQSRFSEVSNINNVRVLRLNVGADKFLVKLIILKINIQNNPVESSVRLALRTYYKTKCRACETR